jgi:hypothetical protein
LFLLDDDGGVVSVRVWQSWWIMADQLADRVAVLEAKMEKVDAFVAAFDKALEVRFRDQAGMLDERFAAVNGRLDKADDQFVFVRDELGILREGISILLKRRK